MDKLEVICNAELCPNYFSVNVSVVAVVFHQQFSKNRQFCLKLLVFENWQWNTTVSRETFIENWLQRNFALNFTSYLSTALSKILPHSKTTKNAKKLSVFGENDSRRLSNFLQTHIFWNFDHISRICNQINYRNIWFPKVIIILIMTTQVFSTLFPKKTRTLMLLTLNKI